MSKRNPIPAHLRGEFVGWMEAHDEDDLPDGAWFANLEAAAFNFIAHNNLKWADENDAVFQYFKLKGIQP